MSLTFNLHQADLEQPTLTIRNAIMNKITVTLLMLSFIVTIALRAELIVSNLEIGPNFASFDISGTIPNQDPSIDFFENEIFFINTGYENRDGFVLGDNVKASGSRFTGSQVLANLDSFSGSAGPAFTGIKSPIDLGDYFYLVFINALSKNETLDGNLTLIWENDAFDLSNLPQTLEIYWGELVETGGVRAGTAAPIVVEERRELWIHAIDLGTGWVSTWFGFFNGPLQTNTWIYHQAMKWLYVNGNADTSLWFFDPASGWQWTANGVFPWAYSSSSQTWVVLPSNP